MGKANPYATKRSTVETFQRKVVSRAAPYNEYVFNVRHLGAVEVMQAMQTGAELANVYAGTAAEPPVEFLPPVDGQPVLVSRAACMVVGSILTAQVGPMEDRYDKFEIFAMMVDDTPAWEDKLEKVGDEEVKREIRLDSVVEQLCQLSDDVAPQERRPSTDPLDGSLTPTSSIHVSQD